MRAFCKTLFGDGHNLGAVALVVAATGAAVALGHAAWAAVGMPVATLLAVGWLARR